jgi:hypothetical protein
MLDVHPPHHPTHTWRDFFVHIATICVGLLIAIGLEQTVEAIHRAHEKHELIQDFHDECSKNIELTANNARSFAADRDLELATVALLKNTAPLAGVVTITLPLRPKTAAAAFPSRAVWSIARSNGKVALLPENLAEIFERADYEASMFANANQTVLDSRRDTLAVADELQLSLTSGHTVSVPAADVHELAIAIAHQAEANNLNVLWSGAWGGACRAVVDNVPSRDAMDAYIGKEVAKSVRK